MGTRLMKRTSQILVGTKTQSKMIANFHASVPDDSMIGYETETLDSGEKETMITAEWLVWVESN